MNALNSKLTSQLVWDGITKKGTVKNATVLNEQIRGEGATVRISIAYEDGASAQAEETLSTTAPLTLWWDAGTHVAREESESVEATTAGFVVRATRLPIAVLRADQDGAGTLQVTLPVVCVKR
jgi:hypothetical protein